MRPWHNVRARLKALEAAKVLDRSDERDEVIATDCGDKSHLRAAALCGRDDVEDLFVHQGLASLIATKIRSLHYICLLIDNRHTKNSR